MNLIYINNSTKKNKFSTIYESITVTINLLILINKWLLIYNYSISYFCLRFTYERYIIYKPTLVFLTN